MCGEMYRLGAMHSYTVPILDPSFPSFPKSNPAVYLSLSTHGRDAYVLSHPHSS